MKNILTDGIEFKAKYIFMTFLAFISFFNVEAANDAFSEYNILDQDRIIKGVITDEAGVPLAGANVIIKGTTKGAMTDFDGKFEIIIKEEDKVLEVSYIGFETSEVPITNDNFYSIALKENSEELEQVVIVGYGGSQKKESLVSSIATISAKEIKTPSSNLTNMIAGRVAGVIAFQRSGEPGADNTDFFIRGLGSFGAGKVNPLILIDGVESSPTDMARLQPDDIQNFSVLKDAAAAAVYGARGANGVVLINTKKGRVGKTTFLLRSDTRLSTNTRNFKFTDNITYMNLANEAALTRNPNAVLPYTQAKINGTAAGDNPYLYPSNNWIDELIKDYTVNETLILNANGGSEKARYYISGSYNVDNGLLDVSGTNDFNNNIKLRNYSLRSTIDVDLTKSTLATVRIYGQFDDYNGPVGGGSRVFNLALWSNPVKFPKVYPTEYLPYANHPLFGGAITGQGSTDILLNPYAEMVRGYETSKASTTTAQLEIKQDFSDLITEGLSFRGMGYLRRYSFYSVSRYYNPFYYTASVNPITNEVSLYNLNDGGPNSIGEPGTEYLNYNEGDKLLDSRIYLETAINYNRTFNEKHEVSGMLINVLSSFETGNAGSVQSSLPNRNHGISGRFTYGYDSRYLAEFNFGYNGSERFASGKRYGFFPSFGLAYNISNEKFWEPVKDVVSNFKVRGTFGLVGNDQIGDVNDRFFYLSNVNLNNNDYGATFGEDFGYYNNGISIDRYANENIGWEKSRQIDIGFDLGFFNSLDLVFDLFHQRRTNILQARSNIGSEIGLQSTPETNFGKAETQGVDISLNYNKYFNDSDLFVQLRGNFTYATSKILEYDEPTYPDNLSHLSVIGQSTSQMYGYIAERLFIDEAEVANSPQQFGQYMGGDIKYRDIDGDGKITSNDIVPLGDPTVPEIVYGFGGTIGYKNFDLGVFFQGVAKTSIFINAENISPFVINGVYNPTYDKTEWYQNGLLDVIANDHWSEANRDSYAFWPRMSDTFIENNNRVSTWWMRDGSFLRLKTIELGYNFKESLINKIGLQSARAYLSGNNIAVWSRFKLWDPELGGNGLGYPIQSVYNLGLVLNF